MKELIVKDAIQNLIDFIAPTKIEYSRLVINTKDVGKSDIFVGIKGSKNDGNAFYHEAYRNGATLVIFDNVYFYKKANFNKVLVKNSVEAIKSIGRWKLERSLARKIAITGSVGKTTTKKMLYEVFSRQYQTFASYKNQNNELGVAISASNVQDDAEYAIFELGTNSFGEIKRNSEYVRPDVAVITRIGTSHIGKFGSRDNLIREKMSIIDVDSCKSLWMYDEDAKYFPEDKRGKIKLRTYGFKPDNDVVIKEIYWMGSYYRFKIGYKNCDYTFELNHFYRHFVVNAALVAGIALSEGIEYEYIDEGLRSFKPEEGRGNILEFKDFTVIDDTYNAGFESVVSGLESLEKLKCDKSKFAIIGEIAEIDGHEDSIYKRLIEFAKGLKTVKVVFCGSYFKDFKSEKNLLFLKNKAELFKFLDKQSKGVFFVKASRSKKFEEVIDYFSVRGGLNAI